MAKEREHGRDDLKIDDLLRRRIRRRRNEVAKEEIMIEKRDRGREGEQNTRELTVLKNNDLLSI